MWSNGDPQKETNDTVQAWLQHTNNNNNNNDDDSNDDISLKEKFAKQSRSLQTEQKLTNRDVFKKKQANRAQAHETKLKLTNKAKTHEQSRSSRTEMY